MRILLVDDNDLVRRGILDYLREHTAWDICGEASDGGQACEKARDLRPDLILLDNSMPGPSGFETARAIRRQNSEVKILILSQEDPRRILPAAIESGADGCVDKSRIYTDLIPAIQKFETEV